MLKCGEAIVNNYLAIETRDNLVEQIGIAATVDSTSMRFYDACGAETPIFVSRHADLTALRLTRVESLAELWFNVELEQGDALHRFVKDHVFRRRWVEFEPRQAALPAAVTPEVGQIRMTLSAEGMPPVEFTDADLKRAAQTRKKGKRDGD